MAHNSRAKRHETARHLMVTNVPIFESSSPIDRVRASFASQTFAFADAVYVTGAGGKLAGELPLANLVARTGHEPVGRFASRTPVTVLPDTDQELVAAAAIRSKSAAVAVVDADGVLLGVVPPLAMMEVMRQEHSEDVHRLAGIRYSSRRAHEALTGTPWLRVLHRVPWLMVGLVGSIVTALAMAGFEALLKAHIAVAFFIPGIVYLADAIGTQTEAIAVRGLSYGHAPLGALLKSELATGALIGALLGGLAFPLTYWGFGSTPISVAVSLAILLASSVAATVGLVLPWLLSSRNLDPAFGSGPLATIIQDILSIVIYLGIVTLLV